MVLDVEFVPSPNYSSRGGLEVIGTVIHYTADGPGWNPIKWLTMTEARASAHYVIERDGDISRLVKLTKKAWHAGVSEMDYHGEINSDASRFTIGIELQNAGLLVEQKGDLFWEGGRVLHPWDGADPIKARLRYDNAREIEGWWEPYTDAQIDSLQELLLHFAHIGYQEAATNLIGHEEIAMPFSDRKKDPGPLFPWGRFSRKLKRRTEGQLLSS